MKMLGKKAITCLLTSFCVYGSAAWADSAKGTDQNPLSILGAPMPASQLQNQRARGEIVVSATNNGNVAGNSVGAGNITGAISNSQSIENNTGITTVLQNTGNNALLQSSTSIYVSAQ